MQDGYLRISVLEVEVDQASPNCLIWKWCRIYRWLGLEAKE